MFNLLVAAVANLWNIDIWYAVPAVLAISLVYSATRHERMRPILIQAVRTALCIAGFMAVIFAVLELMTWQC
jgi:hypothetical protein